MTGVSCGPWHPAWPPGWGPSGSSGSRGSSVGRRRRARVRPRTAVAPLAGRDQGAGQAGDVIEALALDRRRPQGGRWVVHGQHERVSSAGLGIRRPDRPMDLRDLRAGQEARHREAAQRDDDRRIQDLELSRQVRRTGGDLVGHRVAIVRRPALHDVRDEHIRTPPAERTEQLDEQVPGPADERPTFAILVLARALADEDDLGIGIALTGDGLPSGLVQSAARAVPNLGGDDLERRPALGIDHAMASASGSPT